MEAIEAYGTRPVVEQGEEKVRYRFFDDPENDGEHAIFGNTETLNQIVDDLKSAASRRGQDEKILWIEGPTGTGKSELKRCMIDGLKEYSKTEEGRRYLPEWNLTGMGEGDQLGELNIDESMWYESPVQDEPLKLFSTDTRKEILDDLNEVSEDNIDLEVVGKLDPFSRTAYGILEDHYLAKGEDDELLSSIAEEDNVRMKRYVMDKGQGIGVLHAEDSGKPQQKLVGDWMRGMLQELDSQGAKDPRAHSYDGVISQGNRGLTIIEDAIKHQETVSDLLNIPEEGSVKLDTSIEMDVDTVLMMISNPDMEDMVLDKNQEAEESDPMRALRRRMEQHEFNYLTNYETEDKLIRRSLTNDTEILEDDGDVRDPLMLEVRDQQSEVHEKEFAPHAVESAALYNVISRIDPEIELIELDTDLDLDIIDKAKLYRQGKLDIEGEEIKKEDVELEDDRDGENGIPVTYTRDVLANLVTEENDLSHEELGVENVIMPEHVLEGMSEGLDEAPVFSDQGPGDRQSEVERYRDQLETVKEYVEQEQEEDVIDAIMAEKEVNEETIEKYVKHTIAEVTGAPQIGSEDIDVDHEFLKSFETKTLGKYTENEYHGHDASEDVREFREKDIVGEISTHVVEMRGSGTGIEEFLTEIPVVDSLLDAHDWDDVTRFFEELDPVQWGDPKTGTETAEVKDRTIDEMIDMGYSPASAEVTSQKIMEKASENENFEVEG